MYRKLVWQIVHCHCFVVCIFFVWENRAEGADMHAPQVTVTIGDNYECPISNEHADRRSP